MSNLRDLQAEFDDAARTVSFDLSTACEYMEGHTRREFYTCAQEWASEEVPVYTADLWGWAQGNTELVEDYIQACGMPDAPYGAVLDYLFGGAWAMDYEHTITGECNDYVRGVAAYILMKLGYTQVDSDEFVRFCLEWHGDIDFCYDDIESYLITEDEDFPFTSYVKETKSEE